ncbi:C4-dicarboxylate transporter DcuC [Campylobacter molothri]|uniref:C4-dicarboxylate transporter DcuC n=1 Tax=Campylobacter molothri TaxID=1032242 RepID=UPI001EFBDD3A|nr:C4-dicarboxylate transporter DcuC [Campylobacter sp. RM10537]MBZ7949624.1 C4-dicarboxylate transporter DcuC [Campylobacter sp. RM10534]ULO00230.1 anaerobic C4-dicarboxylate transporter, DcuC family [Campylobacter sp. RM10537]
MLGLGLSFLSIFLLIFMLYKKVNAHMALLLSGFLLLSASLLATFLIYTFPEPIKSNYPQIYDHLKNLNFYNPKYSILSKGSLNLGFFDIFEVFNQTLSKTLSGLGLTLMCIAGFSAYMDHVGASYALFKVFEKPLKMVKSPYILLIFAYFISQFLVLFMPSHAGLALLLMTTMYPILIRTGVSKFSALSVIAICQYIDHGPGSGNVIMASNVAKIDPAFYFVHYQLPITLPIIITVAISIYFCNYFFDKKEHFVFDPNKVEEELNKNKEQEIKKPPTIYALLPIIPLILILGFSSVLDSILALLQIDYKSSIKINVPVAMIISTFIAIIFEMIRYKNIVETLNSIMIFFKGMGHLFVITVSLIVCGQVFASGLLSVGFVDTLVEILKNAGVGVLTIIIAISILLAFCAFLMGSGNAAFFSFAPLIPNIAKHFGVETISIITPIQIMTGFGRCVSPIAPAILAISAMTKVNPFTIVKRTVIPMLVASITNIIMTYIYL